MSRPRQLALLALVVLIASGAPVAQAPDTESLVITSPAEGSYVTGPVLLQVKPKMPGSVRSVTFSADGRSVCTVARAPFECNWDAGPGLREHVIRVVATMADGSRAVANSRTRSAGYTESVEVEVVQVTATDPDAGSTVH